MRLPTAKAGGEYLAPRPLVASDPLHHQFNADAHEGDAAPPPLRMRRSSPLPRRSDRTRCQTPRRSGSGSVGTSICFIVRSAAMAVTSTSSPWRPSPTGTRRCARWSRRAMSSAAGACQTRPTIALCTASPNAMAESISSMPPKRSGPAMPVATEETANGPNLLLLMRPSGSDNQPALVPGAKFMKDGGQLPKDPSLIAIVGRGMP